jgi:hypothetical protein
MSKEKVKVLVSILKLKTEFKAPRTISIGNKTIKAVPGEEVTVPRAETDMWLKHGRFDFVRFDETETEVEFVSTEDGVEIPDATTAIESDLPEDIPARDVLVAKGVTFDQVKAMSKPSLIAIRGVGRQYADQILQFLHPETEDTEGGKQ